MRDVLEKLARGQITVDEAMRQLRVSAISEIEDLANLDVGRAIRKGIPEIIFAEGKSPADLVKIALRMSEEGGRAIISRVTSEQARNLKEAVSGREDLRLEFYERSRMAVIKRRDFQQAYTDGRIGILAAGTSDIPVAEEAKIVAEEMGCHVIVAHDVGVAGIHRVLQPLRRMMEEDVDVMVVVAGREGALPTIVAGIVDIPVIGVPTSAGYGLGEKGLGALTSMLQACSLGIATVNIDAGVAAGATAALIANRAARFRRGQR